VHLKITTLVIPGVNDRDEVLKGIAERILTKLGPDIRWHVSGYHPAYRFTAPPTPGSALEMTWRIGKEAGLAFVYVGYVLGHRLENTYCPDYGVLLIERRGFSVSINKLDSRSCPQCDQQVQGVWAAQS
jgi:pyruvate formate lyase activating enzyme